MPRNLALRPRAATPTWVDTWRQRIGGKRIMCLGDSITRDDKDLIRGGWRSHLCVRLAANGVTNLTWVGTLTDTWDVSTTYETGYSATINHHEGHGGQTCAQLATGYKSVGSGGSGWYASGTPDIVLLTAGTNDRDSSAWSALIDQIFTTSPSVKVIAMLIPPSPSLVASIATFNAALPAIAAGKAQYGTQLFLGSHANITGFYGDGIHPHDGADGHPLMATNTYNMIATSL